MYLYFYSACISDCNKLESVNVEFISVTWIYSKLVKFGKMIQKFKGMVSARIFWWYYNAKRGKLKMKLHRVKLGQSERIKVLLFNNPRGKQNRKANWDVLKVVKITQRYSRLICVACGPFGGYGLSRENRVRKSWAGFTRWL